MLVTYHRHYNRDCPILNMEVDWGQMAQTCILALDVGGTTISSAAVGQDMALIEKPQVIASKNDAPKEKLLGTLKVAINEAVKVAGTHDLTIKACSIAFPNPFDYAEGISRMDHKFQSIRDFALGDWLKQQYAFPLFFLNDADAFGLGVLTLDYPNPPARLVTVTLGTGVGSAYITDGEPKELEIWDKPYRAGILEDYISSRAITDEYVRRTGHKLKVKEVAELAFQGNESARDVFQKFGEQIGEGLGAIVGGLHPDAIAIGGAISKSSGLFRDAAEARYKSRTKQSPMFDWKSDDTVALFGAAAYALK